MTRDEVATHLQVSGTVRWTTVANLLLKGSQSCVDGRDDEAVLGTPGGDAGEYLMAMVIIEHLAGRALTTEELSDLFGRYLSSFGRFYMHTDRHAMERLADTLGGDSVFADIQGDQAALEALVRNPGDRAAALLPYLLDPAHVGCGHLKLILLHPEDYGVRNALTRDFLSAVFHALWDGGDIDYTILEGAHAERAVVQICEEGPVHAFSRVPMVAPFNGSTQIFVQHPQVVHWVREQLAQFLVQEEPLIGDVDPADFVRHVSELANRQLGHTLGHLAQGLSVVPVRLDSEGQVHDAS